MYQALFWMLVIQNNIDKDPVLRSLCSKRKRVKIPSKSQVIKLITGTEENYVLDGDGWEGAILGLGGALWGGDSSVKNRVVKRIQTWNFLSGEHLGRKDNNLTNVKVFKWKQAWSKACLARRPTWLEHSEPGEHNGDARQTGRGRSGRGL